MKLKIIMNGPLLVNTYIIGDTHQPCYVIDPGSDFLMISRYIKLHHTGIQAILLTHGHYDHIGAVNELVEQYHCKVYAHPLEMEIAKNPRLNYSSQFGGRYRVQDEISDIFTLQDPNIEIFHTPGHTKGSISILMKNEKLLFSGDTLFKNSVGRTDLFSGNEGALQKSLAFLLSLKEDLLVYPGHDEFTTIESERQNLKL